MRNDVRDDFFDLAIRLFEPPTPEEAAELITPESFGGSE
jgi:hypothetical protein